MNAVSELLANEAEPWKASMGGFCHASLYIEMKDRFCFAPFLGQAAPASIASSKSTKSNQPVTDEVDVGVVRICRPMSLKVIQKTRPVVLKPMGLEVSQGEVVPKS